MAATRKKVIVRDLQGVLYRGYLPAAELSVNGHMELLLPDGRAVLLPAGNVRHVAYVRNFNLDDALDPERMGARSFRSKPRSGGLWVRLQFGPGDTLEGVIRADLSLLDSLLSDHGLFLELPDRTANTQRLYVPRTALVSFDVLGVAGKPASAPRPGVLPASQKQGDLFDLSAER